MQTGEGGVAGKERLVSQSATTGVSGQCAGTRPHAQVDLLPIQHPSCQAFLSYTGLALPKGEPAGHTHLEHLGPC